MNALISGRSGRALILDGESLKSIDVADPSKIVSRQPADLHFLLGEGQDLRVIENSTIESITEDLRHDCDFTTALDLTLISLDAELPDDIRKDALQDLDELLANRAVLNQLENVLYARPLPDDGDLTGALKFYDKVRLPNAYALLRNFETAQPVIFKVSSAWDAIPTKIFDGYEPRTEFQRVAVREGLFRSLVAAETKQAVSTFLLNANVNPAIKQLRNYRPVLQQWTAPFRASTQAPAIKNEIEEEIDTETSPRRRHGRRVDIDRPAMLREVTRRKAIIVDALHRRDLTFVSELVDELVDYQRIAEPVHVAKSLCDLAMEAKELGLYPLQLTLTERSVGIAPGDGWSWAQLGDALLNMQRNADALEAFRQADAFGAGVVAKTGRAEVLKAQGQFPAALAAFDEVISLHPEDLVAKTGRAEVLKAQGQFPAALAAFDEAIRLHPENVVAKTGRAEVLKALGQFDEAMVAYDEVISLHPENVVAKNGRAEVLRAQGQLLEALACYNEAISNHTENRIAKTGRNYILVALGRYDEVLEYLSGQKPVTQDDWIDYHIRGMILLRTGKMSDAIGIFNQGVQNNPWPLSKQYFRSALAIAWLRGREFRKASKMLEEVTASLLQPPANVLRMHAFGAMGERQRVAAAYESLSTTPHLSSHELTQELRHQYLLGEEPRHDDEWVFDREIKIFVLAA
jgi:tetratricopeptide (TPR) repeat protein